MKGPPRGSGNIILCYDIIMYQLTAMGKTQNASRKKKNRREEIKIMGLIFNFLKIQVSGSSQKLKKKGSAYYFSGFLGTIRSAATR